MFLFCTGSNNILLSDCIYFEHNSFAVVKTFIQHLNNTCVDLAGKREPAKHIIARTFVSKTTLFLWHVIVHSVIQDCFSRHPKEIQLRCMTPALEQLQVAQTLATLPILTTDWEIESHRCQGSW